MDGKLLIKAKERLEEIRLQNAMTLESRQRIAYDKAPELRAIEQKLGQYAVPFPQILCTKE